MGWRGHPECLHIFSSPQSLTQILLLSFQQIHNCHFDRREGRVLPARSGEIDPLGEPSL
jgi:hypothetical protein